MDTTNLCRSCMKEVASWEKGNFNPRAVDMFRFCTNLTITEDDNLPQQFCYDCIIKIESSYTYVIEARKVDMTLKSIVSRYNTSVIVEPEMHTTIKSIDQLKLTLPDYKICSTTENFDEQFLFDNIDTSSNEINNIDNDITDNITVVKARQCDIPQSVKEAEDASESKKNVCPVCRKGFISKAWFSKHMEKEHSGKKFVCSHCPKTFSKASQLSYHSASHSDERKFACTACGKRFKQRKQLVTHARAHADARPFACDKCAMRFKLKSVLKCHMKVHEGDKQYLCYFCGWSFAQAGNLKVHMRKHTGEKPFRCSECTFRAAAASSLRRHQRRHRAARPYVCTHCRKGFYDASGLARHVRTHTGELPYPCGSCARAFADSWKRKTHLMRAHRVPLADIPRMRRDARPPIPLLLHGT